ncbi:MAG: class I SAM-dependent methyltransferase [Alphaproteobacteria bacterium]|nr:class I SAM-dependent methyltransferase [Alphaproteobacteria bacterium]
MDETIPCRLCGELASYQFSGKILKDTNVSYYKCSGCGSLQTEEPHWLEAAYSCPHTHTDVGMTQRTIIMSMCTDAILTALEISEEDICIDFGGNNGLFTRMMRDKGLNFHCFEPYTTNYYSPYHTVPLENPTSKPIQAHAVTTFEVFEHFANPIESLGLLFSYSPDVVIFSTELYNGQQLGWQYLSPENGQHIFFYSPKALQLIADHYGMFYLSNGSIHLFINKEPQKIPYRQEELNIVQDLIKDSGKLFETASQTMLKKLKNPYKFVWQDFEEIDNAGFFQGGNVVF